MAQTAKKNFREMSAELEDIVVRLQQGELDIEDAIKYYERGLQLTEAMEQYLKKAETKITRLRAQFSNESDS